uniref:Exostosin domain-containing protein n=1 Tax=Caenorhabditis japonica TaxID=281687 RepID=A0A8R1IHS7_CAEJA
MKNVTAVVFLVFCLFGKRGAQIEHVGRKPCTMATCFDFFRCSASKKVYIHPIDSRFEQSPQSVSYEKILKHFQESDHYTNDPNEACLFLLGIDTTDRDVRSQNYVKNVNEYIQSLDPSVWNGGRNHIIFNFYHGTFPDYDDHNLNFGSGEAMIARASSTELLWMEEARGGEREEEEEGGGGGGEESVVEETGRADVMKGRRERRDPRRLATIDRHSKAGEEDDDDDGDDDDFGRMDGWIGGRSVRSFCDYVDDCVKYRV